MFTKMLNRTLKSVTLSDDKEVIEFIFLDNDVFRFRVEGDCCSQSWIEHLTISDDIDGAVLLSVEQSEGVETPSKEEYSECLQVYNTRFRTTRGDIILEYRNESNGYYGGYIVEDYADMPSEGR